MNLDQSIALLSVLTEVIGSALITIYGAAAILKVAKMFLTF